jgi:hypothetical protein
MSGDHAKKEMVTGEKPSTSHGKAPLGESRNKQDESPPHKSLRSGDKKKKMKKVVYYETDSSSLSTSGSLSFPARPNLNGYPEGVRPPPCPNRTKLSPSLSSRYSPAFITLGLDRTSSD